MLNLFKKVSNLFAPHKNSAQSRALRTIGPIALTQTGNFSRSEYNLVYCQEYDAVWLDPKPNQADLKAMYADGVQFSDDVYTKPERVKLVLEYLSGCVRHRKLIPMSEAAVLEVGAGLSWMNRACKGINPCVRTVAQDVTQEAAAQCPWVDEYYVGEVESMPDVEKFDLISLTHVIEHLLDPRAMIELLTKRLKINGAIFVTAPYRPKGWKPEDGIEPWKSYSYLHVPAHIGYLSERFYQDVCSKIAGLKLESWDASHEEGQAYEVVMRMHTL